MMESLTVGLVAACFKYNNLCIHPAPEEISAETAYLGQQEMFANILRPYAN